MLRAHQTLLEQMRITDSEIQNRLELAALNSTHIKLLKEALPVVEELLDNLVDQFYVSQLSVDEIAVLISDSDTLSRLKSAQKNYIRTLFLGDYGRDYVNNRLRIGLVHKRIGVEPKLYLSAISSLKSILFEVIDQYVTDLETARSTKDALDKLMYFDTTLVFDTYIGSMISELEITKQKTEMYANSLEDMVAKRTEQLKDLALKDSLTDLNNQRAMRELASQLFASAKRRKKIISAIYLDVDNFKQINDRKGHLEGDNVLKEVGNCIKQHTRESDIACRYGGDEFCILLSDTDQNEAELVANRIRNSFEKKYHNYSISMGIADKKPEDDIDIDKLIGTADKKMYEAKSHKASTLAN